MIQMKRMIIGSALALTGIATAGAQEKLVIYADGSEKQAFALADIVKLTLGDESLTVYTTDSQTATFAYADIGRIGFKDLTNGIASVHAGTAAPALYCREGKIGAEGLAAPARAAIVDLGGRTVWERRQWDGSPVSTLQLAKGVYILKVNNNTLKFTR